MELQLTFQNNSRTTIPIDYQYYLSSWIYNILSKGDEKYASFLHDQGYRTNTNGKIFKLFSFSRLFFEYDQNKDRSAFIVKRNISEIIKLFYKFSQYLIQCKYVAVVNINLYLQSANN